MTIERDRVHAFKWFRSETNNALARIRLPDDLEGNAYVSVAFVRDIDSEEIFVSPLSYAVAPFAVDRTARCLDIDLSVPERVLPGSRLTIGYNASEPSRIVLFAVDEGILQVADYSAPDPLGVYLRKKALQVDTHQINTLSAAYTVLALGAIHRSLAAQGQLSPPVVVAHGPDGPVDVAVSDGVFARASLPVSVDRLDIWRGASTTRRPSPVSMSRCQPIGSQKASR